MRKIILAGGSGFLGCHLVRHFHASGDEVVVLTRNLPSRNDGVRYVDWDGASVGDWALELEGASVLINLTGKNVNCRHTRNNIKEINRSRTESIRVLDEALRACQRKPELWIQAAGIAIYGDSGEGFCSEDAGTGKGLLSDTCVLWEEAWNKVGLSGVRKVLLRIGIVLASEGGALAELSGLTRWFLGGRLGTGKQGLSWIHFQDMIRLIEWLIEKEGLEGVFNATAPQPVSNEEFMVLLRKTLGRPWSPPVPAWMMHAAALVLRVEADLVLKGRRVEPRRLLENGFCFEYENLEKALASIYSPEKDLKMKQKI